MVNRRAFLVSVGVATVTLGLAGPPALGRARQPPPILDATAPTGHLPHDDMRTVLALVEVLVSPDHRAPESEYRAQIDEATARVPGLLRAYGDGVRLLDRAARERGTARYAEVSLAGREAIVAGLLWQYGAGHDGGPAVVTRVLRRLERVVRAEDVVRFRHLVARDLLLRHHRRHAWRLVGYRNHPGTPGDPLAYTLPPASP